MTTASRLLHPEKKLISKNESCDRNTVSEGGTQPLNNIPNTDNGMVVRRSVVKSPIPTLYDKRHYTPPRPLGAPRAYSDDIFGICIAGGTGKFIDRAYNSIPLKHRLQLKKESQYADGIMLKTSPKVSGLAFVPRILK